MKLSDFSRDQVATAAKYAVIGAGAIMVAPFVYSAITGIVGIAAAVLVVYGSTQLAPVVELKIKNLKERAIEAEKVEHIAKVSDAAAENPIETLMNQSAQKRQASDQFRTAITMFRTEVRNFETQVAQFAKEYPEDVSRFDTQLGAMNKLLKFREDRYKQLQVELDNFDSAIKRAQAMWKMSQAAQKMNQLAGVEIGDPFEKIKADSAINSVMTSVNKAFAEMETALLDNKEIQQANILENSVADAINISSNATTVKVNR